MERQMVGKKRLWQPANGKQTDRDKCSSIRRMSGEKGDKGMDIAAKSSLSRARKEVRHRKWRKRAKETDSLCHSAR